MSDIEPTLADGLHHLVSSVSDSSSESDAPMAIRSPSGSASPAEDGNAKDSASDTGSNHGDSKKEESMASPSKANGTHETKSDHGDSKNEDEHSIATPTETDGTTTHATRPNRHVVIHPRADMELEVQHLDGSSTIYHVVEACLTMGSDVLRAKIANNHATEDLTTSEGTGLVILLHIMHYNFHQVPKVLDHATLSLVAIVAHQFRCVELLQPWAERWVEHLSTQEPYDEKGSGREMSLICTAWILGCKLLFEKQTLQLIRTSRLIDGHLHDSRGNEVEPDGLPEGVYDFVRSAHLDEIGLILTLVDNAVKDLLDPAKKGNHCRGPAEERKMCEAIMLGSFISSLAQHGLWPIPRTDEFGGSEYQLHQAVSKVIIDRYQERGMAPHKMFHTICGPALQSEVSRFHEARQHTLRPEHVAHLGAQGALTGLTAAKTENGHELGVIPEEEEGEEAQCDRRADGGMSSNGGTSDAASMSEGAGPNGL